MDINTANDDPKQPSKTAVKYTHFYNKIPNAENRYKDGES